MDKPAAMKNPPHTFSQIYTVAMHGDHLKAQRMCDQVQMFYEDQVRASRQFHKNLITMQHKK